MWQISDDFHLLYFPNVYLLCFEEISEFQFYFLVNDQILLLFNPLMSSGNKSSYILKQESEYIGKGIQFNYK